MVRRVRRKEPAPIEIPDAAITPPQTGLYIPDYPELWEYHGNFKLIREAAQALLVSPLGLLGAVLGNVLANIGPDIGVAGVGRPFGAAPLNLFVALAGKPGTGKKDTDDLARKLVPLREDVLRRPQGTGQGLQALYVHTEKDQASGEVRMMRDAGQAQIACGEVENLSAHADQKGANIMPVLRSAWSGELLGGTYRDPKFRTIVEDGTYRLCLSVGVQPGLAGKLMDATGGTRHRFLWLPVCQHIDRANLPKRGETREIRPLRCWAPAGMDMTRPREIGMCDQAWDEALEHTVQRKNGEIDADNAAAHYMQMRSRITAGLAALTQPDAGAAGGLPYGNAELWHHAGSVMDASERCLRWMEDAEMKVAREKTRAQTKVHVDQQLQAHDKIKKSDRDDTVNRKAERMFSKAKKRAEEEKPVTDWVLGQALDRDERREYFDDALKLLIEDRRIIPGKDGYSLG